MRALVVYESMYGNTRRVAESIAAGIADTIPVDVIRTSERSPAALGEYALVVLGGPTHAFGMSTPESRAEPAKRHEAPPAHTAGAREWLPNLRGFGGDVGLFDTRMGFRRAPGAASRAMARTLRRWGIRPLGRRSFLVKHMEGPLEAGELALARTWGAELAVRIRNAEGPSRV